MKLGSNPDWIHSVCFDAALINLSERFIIIYATEMIKACRYLTPIGNSIPLNDPEKQFSCFVWLQFFFQFRLAIFPCEYSRVSSPLAPRREMFLAARSENRRQYSQASFLISLKTK